MRDNAGTVSSDYNISDKIEFVDSAMARSLFAAMIKYCSKITDADIAEIMEKHKEM